MSSHIFATKKYHEGSLYSRPEEIELTGTNSESINRSPSQCFLSKFSSLPSINFFSEDEPFSQKSIRNCNGVLLRGPRRLLRLCIFGLLLPVVLVTVPLYVRLILYPPVQFIMAPTDQRLLHEMSSSFWCSGQTVYMNGSFNAYVLPDAPETKKNYSSHSMLQHIVLKDDVKEYWGFYLRKNSIVSINICSRYDGGTLMIMRGVKNLRKCAWIGEEDSAEQDEDHQDISNESGQESDGRYPEIPMAPGELLVEVEKEPPPIVENQHLSSNEKMNLTSEERREELHFYIKKILKLSKSNKEIFEKIKTKPMLNGEKAKINKKRNNRKRKKRVKKLGKKNSTVDGLVRKKRSLGTALNLGTDANALKEDLNNLQAKNITNNIYSILKLTKGLTYERGALNQTTSGDHSSEEHRSSYSSSEEALAKCEGLIGVLPLYSSRECNDYSDINVNKIKYRVPITGTYYFVFSSDNEVFDLDMYFNMTLERIVYDIRTAKDNCTNITDCSLPFTFFSEDQSVVEVPEGDWNSTYTMEIRCQPRVTVYLFFLILIPFFILFCAFH